MLLRLLLSTVADPGALISATVGVAVSAPIPNDARDALVAARVPAAFVASSGAVAGPVAGPVASPIAAVGVAFVARIAIDGPVPVANSGLVAAAVVAAVAGPVAAPVVAPVATINAAVVVVRVAVSARMIPNRIPVVA